MKVSLALGVFLNILILSVVVKESQSILCYQCASTSPENNSCQLNTEGMLNDTNDFIEHSNHTDYVRGFIKNCTAAKASWDRCMIEERRTNGAIKHYHRGCADGVNLDFEHERFVNVTPTNASTCADVGNHLVCYTMCDTDLCNGPQATITIDACANWTDVDPYEFYDVIPPQCLSGCPPLDALNLVYYSLILGALLVAQRSL